MQPPTAHSPVHAADTGLWGERPISTCACGRHRVMRREAHRVCHTHGAPGRPCPPREGARCGSAHCAYICRATHPGIGSSSSRASERSESRDASSPNRVGSGATCAAHGCMGSAVEGKVHGVCHGSAPCVRSGATQRRRCAVCVMPPGRSSSTVARSTIPGATVLYHSLLLTCVTHGARDQQCT